MEAVFQPLTHLVERIRTAATDGTPLRIRGHGSKDFYGNTAEAALVGELLDTAPLQGVTSYEPSELVISVRAGTPLAHIEALLAEHGQCLPFEPPQFGAPASSAFGAADPVVAADAADAAGVSGHGTVGGMVAAGLSGPARASVGAVRDYVLGATLVNGRGEVLRFGGTVMKNVAGYDVSRVLAGSLGVLGLIAELSLKVLPAAPAEATLRFSCTQADALRLLNGWGGQPLPLNASCWVDDASVTSPGGAAEGSLYLRLRGAVAAVEAACAKLGGERQDNTLAARDWRACRDQSQPWFTARAAHDLWRLSVPQTAPVLALNEVAAPLIEWHGAQRWYALPAGTGHDAARQADQLRAAAQQAGGHATLFRAGVGHCHDVRADNRFTALAPSLARIHRALKHELDPHAIFNPGRLHAEA